MENDPLNFLEGKVEEPIATPEVTPEPAPQGEPAATPAAPTEDRGYIPIAAVLDEREKRQKAEREAEELRRWKAEQEAKQSSPPPDFFTDPDQRLSYERQQFAQELWNEKLNTSELIARQAFGDDVVEAAQKAFAAAAAQNPALAMDLRRHVHPYKFVVDWHKRERFLSEVGPDPDAWSQKREAELRAKIEAELREKLAAETPPARRPPVSLASAPAAGRATDPAIDPLDRIAR